MSTGELERCLVVLRTSKKGEELLAAFLLLAKCMTPSDIGRVLPAVPWSFLKQLLKHDDPHEILLALHILSALLQALPPGDNDVLSLLFAQEKALPCFQTIAILFASPLLFPPSYTATSPTEKQSSATKDEDKGAKTEEGDVKDKDGKEEKDVKDTMLNELVAVNVALIAMLSKAQYKQIATAITQRLKASSDTLHPTMVSVGALLLAHYPSTPDLLPAMAVHLSHPSVLPLFALLDPALFDTKTLMAVRQASVKLLRMKHLPTTTLMHVVGLNAKLASFVGVSTYFASETTLAYLLASLCTIHLGLLLEDKEALPKSLTSTRDETSEAIMTYADALTMLLNGTMDETITLPNAEIIGVLEASKHCVAGVTQYLSSLTETDMEYDPTRQRALSSLFHLASVWHASTGMPPMDFALLVRPMLAFGKRYPEEAPSCYGLLLSAVTDDPLQDACRLFVEEGGVAFLKNMRQQHKMQAKKDSIDDKVDSFWQEQDEDMATLIEEFAAIPPLTEDEEK